MGDRTGVQKWSLLLCVFFGRCIKKCINVEYMIAIAGSTAPQAGHLQKPSKTKGKSHQNPRKANLPSCPAAFLPSIHPSLLPSFLPSFRPGFVPSFLPSLLPCFPSCLSLFLFFIFLLMHFYFFLMHLYFLLMHSFFPFDASPRVV